MEKIHSKRTLLLGMGNPILRDDAIGIRLTRDIERKLAPLNGLEIVSDCSLGGLNLLTLLEGYDRLIVIDSIKTRTGHCGDWYYFTADGLQMTRNLSCVHDANFATSLELGRRMGMKLPPDEKIHIFAVEVTDNQTFDEKMSRGLEAGFPELARTLLARVQDIINA